MASEPAPDPDDLARHLRAYQRAQSRHRRRLMRYTQGGRKAYLNLSDHEDRMVRQASQTMRRILDKIAEEDET